MNENEWCQGMSDLLEEIRTFRRFMPGAQITSACFEMVLDPRVLADALASINRTIEDGIEKYQLIYDNQHARRHGLDVGQVTAKRHAAQ